MFVFSKGKPKTFNPIMVKKSEKSLQRGKSGRDVSFREISLPTKMIVMSDGDFIRNGIDARTGRPNPLGYYKYSQQTFANKELLVNAVEWLTDDNGIIAARSKDVKMRLLDNKKVQSEKTFWQLLNMLLPIALVVFAGFLYNIVRKRKYTNK